ncbi:MADF domain-containing protein, partial [Aphis craccivora]
TLVQTCEECWKNLRTVLLRHLRQKVLSGSSGEDAMQFIIPFVKSGKQQQGNLLISSEFENNRNIYDTQPDMKQINSSQKRQFKRKVLDVIGCILEALDSLNVSSRSNVVSYSLSSMVPQYR